MMQQASISDTMYTLQLRGLNTVFFILEFMGLFLFSRFRLRRINYDNGEFSRDILAKILRQNRIS